MNKLFLLYFLIIIYNCSYKAQVIGIDIDTSSPNIEFKTGESVLDFMYQKYKEAPCKAYTFSQKNKHYRNDSIIGTSEWYESIEFPDKFRIDFGIKTDGNFIIFKNDSSYRYKKFMLKKTSYDSNTLLLLLGGMYYRELNDVKNRLQKAYFNTSILSSQKWQKQHVYVIGANIGDTLSNQIWVSKRNWRIVRIIEKTDENHTMDMTFDAYQKNCNGTTETKVTFKNNGKIEQVEEYFDINHIDVFSPEVFNPKNP